VGLFALGFDPFLVGEAHLTPRPRCDSSQSQQIKAICPALWNWAFVSIPESGLRLTGSRHIRSGSGRPPSGSGEAEVRLAVARVRSPRDSSERAEAVQTLWREAQAGSVLAVVALAYCREVGIGVPQQKGEARAIVLYRGGTGKPGCLRCTQAYV